MALLILALFITLCVIGMPIAFGIGFTTLVAFLALDGKMMVLAQKMFTGANGFAFICIPLFILAAEIMSEGRLIERIVDFCNVIVGHIRGGLACVNVLDSMVFAGITGSSTADMASLGKVMVEMMDKAGYDRTYATALSASSATIAPLIPPSTIMIIFSTAAGGVSIGKLFVGGAIPGVIYGLAQFALVIYFARKYRHPKTARRATIREIVRQTRVSLVVLVLPAIIFGSIVFGIATPTEAGSLAVCYALIVTVAKRSISMSKLFNCFVHAGILTASVIIIVATASAMGWVVTSLQIPQSLTRFCLDYIDSPVMFLVFVNVLLLLVGCLMDGAPAVLLLVPILFPAAMRYGIDPVHFGIVVCMNLTIGLITPPVGMMLFVGSNVTGVKLSALYKAVLPFVFSGLCVLALVTYVPWLSTFLLSYMR